MGCDGTPNRPNGCIVICEAGPNHLFDGCTMAVDAVAAGQPGIMLDLLADLPNPPPPLQDGNLVCAVDRCGLDGNPDEAGAILGDCALVTRAAPVPALSPGGMAVVLGVFALIAALGIIRRRRELN